MKSSNMIEAKISALKLEGNLIKFSLLSGILASYIQLVYAFGRGNYASISAWLKATMIEGTIALIVRYISRAKQANQSTFWLWVGLVFATLLSIYGNIRYEIHQIVTKAIQNKSIYANFSILSYSNYSQLDTSALITWELITKHVDWIQWLDTILFSGSVPVFVMVLSVVYILSDITYEKTEKQYQEELKTQRKAKLQALRSAASNKGMSLEDYIQNLKNKKESKEKLYSQIDSLLEITGA